MGNSLKRFRDDQAELARRARELRDSKHEEAPQPAKEPPKEGPYQRLLRRLREDIEKAKVNRGETNSD